MFGMLHSQATATEKFLKGILDVISEDCNTHVVQLKRESSIVHTSWYCGYCEKGKVECLCPVSEILKSGEFPVNRSEIEEAVTTAKGVLAEAKVSWLFFTFVALLKSLSTLILHFRLYYKV